MSEHCYLACDLGAESGRVICGRLKNGRLTLEELHRFQTGATIIGESLRWNVVRIFEELKTGLRKAAQQGIAAESMSVDSWADDYVLFNQRQPVLSLPYHYRDARTEAPFQAAQKQCREKIFAETGAQPRRLNTLYQLLDDIEHNPGLLAAADGLLNIADAIHYLFCGTARAEESLASTSEIYNQQRRQWSRELIETFHLPQALFPQLVPAGTKLGTLLPSIQEETGMRAIAVCATCSHDTGAAFAAVPAPAPASAQSGRWACVSMGTWAPTGIELPTPLINPKVLEAGFTNEGGYGGTTRFLKNITGLWILQESRREWTRKGRQLTYDEIDRLAEQAEPFRSLINPVAPRFIMPGSMPAKIAAYCKETGQPEPQTEGQIARCILESMALAYRLTLDQIETLTSEAQTSETPTSETPTSEAQTSRKITRFHIIGGGSRSALLNQFAASGTGREVLAGPVEATACGNILIQALALGHLKTHKELREIVANSFPINRYRPENTIEWNKAFKRFTTLPLSE